MATFLSDKSHAVTLRPDIPPSEKQEHLYRYIAFLLRELTEVADSQSSDDAIGDLRNAVKLAVACLERAEEDPKDAR